MPSEAAYVTDDGKIRCQLAGDDIPKDVCEREQDADACKGCAAPTRRCTACGKARGIADAKHGWCERCLSLNGEAPRRQAPLKDVSEQSHVRMLDRVRAIGAGQKAAAATQPREKAALAAVDPSGEPVVEELLERFRSATDAHLSEREAGIIRALFGIGGTTPLTYEDAGARFDLSKQRVYQIGTRSLEKLVGHGITSAEIETLKRHAGRSRVKSVPGPKPERLRSLENATAQGPQESPLLGDLSALHCMLMEHAVWRSNAWSVAMPRTLLIRRARLLPDEADMSLHRLATEGFLRGASPWNEAVLLKTDGIEAAQAAVVQASPGNGGLRKRDKRKATASVPVPPAETPPPTPVPQAPAPTPPTISVDSLPSRRALATHREMYAYLLTRASVVRDERVIGGAIPSLQIRFRLGAQQAVEFLEWLVARGHAKQKDGWRTVQLLSEGIVSEEGPAPAAPVMAVRPSGPVSLERATAELKRVIPAIRRVRDEVDGHLVKLEGVLATLKGGLDPSD